VAQGVQAPPAHQHPQPQGGLGQQHRLQPQVQGVAPSQEWQGSQGGQGHQPQPPAGQPGPSPHATLLPSSPSGRQMSTRASRPNTMATVNSGR
jgi:hypothetical protein